MSIVLWGLVGGLVAMAATTLGAVPALIGRSMSQRTSDTMLGFAAGVMLSASYFSLILPGIAAAEEQHGSVLIAALIAGAGIALGSGFGSGLGLGSGRGSGLACAAGCGWASAWGSYCGCS